MRKVTRCCEKTLCDSVKCKNSPVGSLMWTWWWLLFCLLLSVAIGRIFLCVSLRLCLANGVAYTALFPPLMIQFFTCLILYHITHFMFAAMRVFVSVFVSVFMYLCLSHLPIGLFFPERSLQPVQHMIICVPLWTDSETIQWKQTVCPDAVGAFCTCLSGCVCACAC